MLISDGVHIPLNEQKFQQCCVKGCIGDIRTELIHRMPTGHTYYFPFCHRDDCLECKEDISAQLESGGSLSRLKLWIDLQDIFINPEDTEYKVKYLIWKVEKSAPAPAPPEPVDPVPQTLIVNIYASDDWEYIDDIDCWRNAEGSVVHIRNLETAEMIDAALTVRDVNFKSVTKKIRWTGDIYIDPKRPRYIYPTPTIKMGANTASEKLQEFEAAIRRRGII